MKETESLKLARRFLGKEVEVVFDRPVGTKHPKYDFVYEQNYGNIPGILAPDGEDLDAFFLGETKPLEKATGTCIAILHRRDDDDDKLVVVPNGFAPTDEEITKLVYFQEQFFDSVVVRK
ncbi:MAG: inorganic pyrophosphatase [bacterium]|nr:inorganic pyrophosphatase [bacterium]